MKSEFELISYLSSSVFICRSLAYAEIDQTTANQAHHALCVRSHDRAQRASRASAADRRLEADGRRASIESLPARAGSRIRRRLRQLDDAIRGEQPIQGIDHFRRVGG